jgi:hypothetical protein
MKRATWTALPALAALLLLVAACAGAGGDGSEADARAPGLDTSEPDGETAAPGEDTLEAGEDAIDPADDTREPPGDSHGVTCPPPGPYGTEQGDFVTDAVLVDCDGVEHTVHGLCDTKVTWIFSFSGW